MNESAAPAPIALAAALGVAVVLPLVGFMVGAVWTSSGGDRAGAGHTVLLAAGLALTALLAVLGLGSGSY